MGYITDFLRSTSNSLRAAVFGFNDGLVTSFSLILGVALASSSITSARLAGLAGLVAGSVSMAAGEYVSVRTQTEALAHERDLAHNPDHSTEELTQEFVDYYTHQGLPPKEAQQVATTIMAHPTAAENLHILATLSIDPNELGGAAPAAFYSFLLFALGALIPLIPLYFTNAVSTALSFSIPLTVLSVILVGLYTASRTAHGPAYTVTRQLIIATLAATITFGVTTLLGS